MLRGNSPARIDDKGRLKVPNGFRVAIQDTHGRELFVTSLTGESVRLYPMPVWLEIEQRLAQMPSTHPARQKFLDRQVTEHRQLTGPIKHHRGPARRGRIKNRRLTGKLATQVPLPRREEMVGLQQFVVLQFTRPLHAYTTVLEERC